MNTPTTAGSILAAGLILFGAFAVAVQVRGWRRLKATPFLPSDERAYFRSRYRRRFVTGFLIFTIGGMIGGAYLSGMERRADALGERKPDAGEEKVVPPEEDKQFVRFWGGYWIIVIVMVFTVLGLAFADAWATRRYAMQQFRTIKEDHEVKLRRDLAMYVQQKQATRGGISGKRVEEE